MNKANLHKLIYRYEENFYILNNSEHDEIFKWRAAKQFRDVWFSKEAEAMPFSAKFALATKHFSVLTDNSYISPSSQFLQFFQTGEADLPVCSTVIHFARYFLVRANKS